ncbi:MAG: two-component sensor histidine kinase, partial [Treponema sp.]|nr:two-component sensor histidine kinase [Treponema sp.]
MTISLRNRMVLTYSLFICVFILLLSFVINQFALWLFQGFVRDSADEQSRQAAVLVSEQYSPETG